MFSSKGRCIDLTRNSYDCSSTVTFIVALQLTAELKSVNHGCKYREEWCYDLHRVWEELCDELAGRFRGARQNRDRIHDSFPVIRSLT
jgi:hypothetical protein